jgi:hypothetical protein
MNWNVGITIWWKGVLIFSSGLFILCIVGAIINRQIEILLLEIFLVLITLILSWPAIILYSVWLRFAEYFHFSSTVCLLTMVIPASLSVFVAFSLCEWTVTNSLFIEVEFFKSLVFLAPLLCCMLSIFLSKRNINDYIRR